MHRRDEEIKKDIVDQLFWDDRVDASDVNVEVDKSNVILKGTVPSYNASQAAREDAWSVDGVTSVEHHLQVKFSLPRAAPDDYEIEADVTNRLKWHPDLNSNNIKVSADNGWITLIGDVDAYWKKALADEIAYGAAGVVGVTNQINSAPGKAVADEAIYADVMAALDRNMYIDADQVDVKVEDSIVTLTGAVISMMAYNAAHEAALYTAGVREVRNNLQIRSVS